MKSRHVGKVGILLRNTAITVMKLLLLMLLLLVVRIVRKVLLRPRKHLEHANGGCSLLRSHVVRRGGGGGATDLLQGAAVPLLLGGRGVEPGARVGTVVSGVLLVHDDDAAATAAATTAVGLVAGRSPVGLEAPEQLERVLVLSLDWRHRLVAVPARVD